MNFHDTCQHCEHCSMDMDLEPYCVRSEVLAKRTAETKRDYPAGLDINVAIPLCNRTYFEKRSERI